MKILIWLLLAGLALIGVISIIWKKTYIPAQIRKAAAKANVIDGVWTVDCVSILHNTAMLYPRNYTGKNRSIDFPFNHKDISIVMNLKNGDRVYLSAQWEKVNPELSGRNRSHFLRVYPQD